jgi:deoxyribodipyrimidine photolyase-related protein
MTSFLHLEPYLRLGRKHKKPIVMENFYRKQRLRLGILVKDGKPEGDAWNFDEDNRLPPPKNYSWDKYPETISRQNR